MSIIRPAQTSPVGESNHCIHVLVNELVQAKLCLNLARLTPPTVAEDTHHCLSLGLGRAQKASAVCVTLPRLREYLRESQCL